MILLSKKQTGMTYLTQKRRMMQQAKQIAQAATLPALSLLLEENAFQLLYLGRNPAYQVFTLPKPAGGSRLIETPAQPLKKCLQKLNAYLQALYYANRTGAAYGFVAQPHKDPDTRNIITNAQRHLGNGWLVNIDLKDFFHQVLTGRMAQIFGRAPFKCQPDAATLLASLVTFNGRLPMGAPTSPVCSNFAAMEADAELLHYAKANRLTFTRFADDLSFSSARQPPQNLVTDVKAILKAHRFTVNPKKIKQFGPKDQKMVTGLVVGEKAVDIAQGFMDTLLKDIERFKHIWQVQCGVSQTNETAWVQTFKQAVEGKLNFVGMVYGYNSDRYQYVARQYEQCFDIEEFLESRSWLDIPYQF
jgi:RNA-directed DNA polymerase